MRRLGQYVFEREIARGGMGVVYDAYDERLQRRVALKLLLGEFAEDRGFRTRFIRESRAAAALDHPSILPVFDAGEVDGVLYIATRLIDGVDLRQHLACDGTLGVERSLAIVGQIAAALDYAHNRDIVHRDVKPGNVLLAPDDDGESDHAYLIDFGTTTSQSRDMRLTATGQFVGTPEYISPEQISDVPVDGRADQYGLACVLYHCVTGSSPFEGRTTVDVLHAHLHEAPPHAADAWPSTPAALDAAIVRALSKDPTQRFPTCRAFVAAARQASGPALAAGTTRGSSWSASRPTVLESRRPVAAATPTGPSRHKPPLAGIAAALLLLAAGGAAAAAVLGGGNSGRPRAVAATTAARIVATSTNTHTTRSSPPAVAPVATPTQTQTQPQPTLVNLDPTTLQTQHVELSDYGVDLPAGWTIKPRDAPQPTTPGVTRRRTEATDDDLDVSVLLDVLTGYATSAQDNRTQLDQLYAEKKPGYQRIGFSDYDIDGDTAYQWSFRYDAKTGAEARRVDVSFNRGPYLFAVLAAGEADYDVLATLARQTAETIVVDDASAPPPSPATVTPLPEDGTYKGIGYQHSATGAVRDDDYRVRFTFDGDEATVDYPDLACGGSLTADGTDGSRRIYDEGLDHGTCAHGGSWAIETLSDDALQATWTLPSHRYVVRAKLTK